MVSQLRFTSKIRSITVRPILAYAFTNISTVFVEQYAGR